MKGSDPFVRCGGIALFVCAGLVFADAAPALADSITSAVKSASLVNDADGSSTISPGDTIRYSIAITGDAAENSFFGDPIPDADTIFLPGTVTTTQGSVQKGNGGGDTSVEVLLNTLGSATVTFDVRIANPMPAFKDLVVNRGAAGCVDCPGGTDDPQLLTNLLETAVDAAPNVTATKTVALQSDNDGSSSVTPGDRLRYTVVITNTGNEDAGDGGLGAPLLFVDEIPDANTTLVAGSVTTTKGTINDGNTGGDTRVEVDLDNLAGGGGSATIRFDVIISNPLPAFTTQVVNQGGVACGNCSPTTILTDDPGVGGADDPTAIDVDSAPDVSATKTDALVVDNDGSGDVNPGDTVRYTVVITNAGNQDAGNAVAPLTFVDSIPDANTSLVVGSVTTTQGTITTGNTGGDTTVDVELGILGGGGGSATITFDVTVRNPMPAFVNIIFNQGAAACANCDPQAILTNDPVTPEDDDATFTNVVAAPDVTATKAATLQSDNDGDGQISPGDQVRYTVVITNNGDQDAGNPVPQLDPPVDAPITFTDSNSDPLSPLVVGSVTTTLGTVESGNTGGDTQVDVNMGTLAGAGGTATITYDVLLVPCFPAFVNQVGNVGAIVCANCTPNVIFTEDPNSPGMEDPDTEGPQDPTIVAVVAAPDILAKKVAVLQGDTNGNGEINPNEVVRYIVVIANAGNQDAGPVADPETPALVFLDILDAYTNLVVGSVTTTVGEILSGNNPGDAGVATKIDTTFSCGARQDVTFDVRVKSSIIASVDVANQGDVSGPSFGTVVTDDPNTDEPDDPTVFRVEATPPLPAAGPIGLALLVLLLIGIAALQMRREKVRVRK